MLAVVVYACLYVILSLPSFQQKVKTIICEETSFFLGGKVDIGRLSLSPFSEVVLNDVSLYSPDGEKCINIGKVAAGIDIWAFMVNRKIVLNYAEISGLDVTVEQKEEKGPLNIKFLIDALSTKDQNKPSALFDLKIRNIIVRNSKSRFLRSWMRNADGEALPFSDVNLSNLRIDLSIPVLKNDLFRFNIRNMRFDLDPGVSVRSLSADIVYEKNPGSSKSDRISVNDLNISFPNSSLTIGDFSVTPGSLSNLDATVAGSVTPSDFAQLLPQLHAFDKPWDILADTHVENGSVEVSKFELVNQNIASSFQFKGGVENYMRSDSLNAYIDVLHMDLSGKLLSDIGSLFGLKNEKIKYIFDRAGNLSLDAEGKIKNGSDLWFTGSLETSKGILEFEGSANGVDSHIPLLKLNAVGEDIELGEFLGDGRIGTSSFNLEAEVAGIDKNAEGRLSLSSDKFEVMGKILSGVELEIEKKKDDITGSLGLSSETMNVDLNAMCKLAGRETKFETDLIMSGVNLGDFGVKGALSDCTVSSGLHARIKGNHAENITGSLIMSDLSIIKPGNKRLCLPELKLDVDSIGVKSNSGLKSDVNVDELLRKVNLTSNWIDGIVTGVIVPESLGREIKMMLSCVFPTIVVNNELTSYSEISRNSFDYSFYIKGVADPYDFFKVPVRPLSDLSVKGCIHVPVGNLDVQLLSSYLLQGKDKLIRDLALNIDLDSRLGILKSSSGVIYPTKKGDLQLAADIYASGDKVRLDMGFNPTLQSAVKGSMSMVASFSKQLDPIHPGGTTAVNLEILPSVISVSDTPWSIANGEIAYSGKKISVDNFLISHDHQYIKINGTASENPNDVVNIKLNEIDLEYIFNILNINYVSFGGMASGEVEGSKLLTKMPEARTLFLRVNNLSYNGAVLGDGDLASEYDAKEQKVGIYAVIREPLTKKFRASVDGGIWVTRDSLSFNMNAQHLNVGLMKPFVSAFCTELRGEASGKCKLFGTFQDIDLTGALMADTLSMRLDFTNTWYHAGGDSVFLHTGVIEIPPLTLYDDGGHTAEFSGWLRHRYFHEPVFNFRVRDAQSLLCYDTNEKINPLWYGTIYGTGHAQINGYPGIVEIDMNMMTEDNSRFYYVISDAEEVEQYSFLTFTDRRKEQREVAHRDTVPDYLTQFMSKKAEEESLSSNVVLSLKGTVNNDALVTIVMDPKAGDNITARGQGALQMDYNMASNDLRMIGSYILDEGNYNFSLQDIIIKNFNIRKGSMITFDGDPMNANLDITATYRVNTNLTDLDKSFSTDRELNRTNVPVDALLMVKGPMTHPDINFDIELPSLTSDVERKVKSIVSTNDMMNRQIIYLLALNRFYTPEYTESSATGNGSEWSSMASSTISSQLSNILSQMTDKLDMAPSFRSDKGDFTDMEFDLALSSRLLNNRLLINGNFGYRDRSTSNTQFVGDFDIEYLLSKNGSLRLKAYNHFNDQNYYLRSALTTQGVGVVFRKDFDRLFGIHRRSKERIGIDLPDSLKTSNNNRIDIDSIIKTQH